ncbi:hypothetical protein LX36DRAFT_442422 [Colletotrichum falcatum]|nr:hypothetical protein LX36DRAFT_442422 [Colletotrichum falcatum]
MSLVTTYGSLACWLSPTGSPAPNEPCLDQHPRSRQGHKEAHSPLASRRSVFNVHTCQRRCLAIWDGGLDVWSKCQHAHCRTSDPVQLGKTGKATEHLSRSRCILARGRRRVTVFVHPSQASWSAVFPQEASTQ